jgi:hypothetical protein
MTPEGKVKKKVREVLQALRAYYVMPMTGGYGNSGAPDFVVCFESRFIGIECKAAKGKLTALQEKNLAQIRSAGGLAIVVNEENIDELKEKLINYWFP